MNLTSGMLNGHVPCKPVAPKLFTGCFLLSAELARPLREFPAQSSHECRDCLAELDVTTANGQVGCATQLPGMQSKEHPARAAISALPSLSHSACLFRSPYCSVFCILQYDPDATWVTCSTPSHVKGIHLFCSALDPKHAVHAPGAGLRS